MKRAVSVGFISQWVFTSKYFVLAVDPKLRRDPSGGALAGRSESSTGRVTGGDGVMRPSAREPLAAIAFGLGFSIAVMGLGALASEMGDPWGLIVLAVIAPGMPLLGNRGDSLLPALIMCFVAWGSAGALIWTGIIWPSF
jgi:hypothetical protein